MQQFDVKRGSRKCCVTEQLFGPGVFFYSALIETTTGAIRNDYSSQAWKESPWSQKRNQETPTTDQSKSDDRVEEQTLIGWWKQRVPDLDSGKVYWAPDHVLLAWFDSLYDRQNEENKNEENKNEENKNEEENAELNETAWVMALLLMQKRLLSRHDDDTDQDILSLFNKKTNQEYRLREPKIDNERINTIQKQLEEQLFSDLPIAEDG